MIKCLDKKYLKIYIYNLLTFTKAINKIDEILSMFHLMTSNHVFNCIN